MEASQRAERVAGPQKLPFPFDFSILFTSLFFFKTNKPLPTLLHPLQGTFTNPTTIMSTGQGKPIVEQAKDAVAAAGTKAGETWQATKDTVASVSLKLHLYIFLA